MGPAVTLERAQGGYVTRVSSAEQEKDAISTKMGYFSCGREDGAHSFVIRSPVCRRAGAKAEGPCSRRIEAPETRRSPDPLPLSNGAGEARMKRGPIQYTPPPHPHSTSRSPVGSSCGPHITDTGPLPMN